MRTTPPPRRAELDAGKSARIERALRREWPLIARVHLRPVPGGSRFEAAIELDPLLVRARAGQQGLRDRSYAAAAASPRVHAALATCVDRVNATLPAPERIVGWTVLS